MRRNYICLASAGFAVTSDTFAGHLVRTLFIFAISGPFIGARISSKTFW